MSLSERIETLEDQVRDLSRAVFGDVKKKKKEKKRSRSRSPSRPLLSPIKSHRRASSPPPTRSRRSDTDIYVRDWNMAYNKDHVKEFIESRFDPTYYHDTFIHPTDGWAKISLTSNKAQTEILDNKEVMANEFALWADNIKAATISNFRSKREV
jgi:hypothetical protein